LLTQLLLHRIMFGRLFASLPGLLAPLGKERDSRPVVGVLERGSSSSWRMMLQNSAHGLLCQGLGRRTWHQSVIRQPAHIITTHQSTPRSAMACANSLLADYAKMISQRYLAKRAKE